MSSSCPEPLGLRPTKISLIVVRSQFLTELTEADLLSLHQVRHLSDLSRLSLPHLSKAYGIVLRLWGHLFRQANTRRTESTPQKLLLRPNGKHLP
jgi:hypothetical protein